jgi:hypothetical protein
MIASLSVFISHTVTDIASVYKHYLCIYGKSREENSVQTVCKKADCASFVQVIFAPDSVQACAKILARRGAWLASGASEHRG